MRFESSFLFSALPVCYLYRELCWCYILSCTSLNKSGARIFSLLSVMKKGNLM
jgi:hypothetical protein